MPTYTDLDLAFTRHPATHDLMKKTDVDAVKGAMRNILLTNIGQKSFDRFFGLGLQGALFELNDNLTQISIERKIKEVLARYEPRVVVEKVIFVYEDDTALVDLYYYIVGVAELQSLNISVERVR